MTKYRQQVLEKTDGKCFYCGCDLRNVKGWNEDHFYPVIRIGNKMAYPELDCYDNLVPSCAPCNNFKNSYDIEGYRKLISDQFVNVQKYSTGMRQLVRLGLVDMTPKPVEFYYEKVGIKMKSEAEIVGLLPDAAKVEWYKDNSEPNYYGADIGKYFVTLRHMGSYWLAIAVGNDWDTSNRKEFPNSRLYKQQAADWALRLNEVSE